MRLSTLRKTSVFRCFRGLIILSILISTLGFHETAANAVDSNAGSISGKLLDESLQDFTELTIYAYPADGRSGAGTAKPRYDGTFTVLNLPAGDYNLYIVSYARQTLAQWYMKEDDSTTRARFTVSPRENLSILPLALIRGARMSGKVLLPTGVDPTKVYVSISEDESPGKEFTVYEKPLNQDGTYVVDGIYPGSYWIRFESNAPGALSEPYPFSETWRSSLVKLVDRQELKVDVSLEPPSSITGRLLSAPGVSVSKFYAQAHRPGEVGVTSSGDVNDDGTFTIGGLRAGSYEVHFTDYDQNNFFVDRWYGGGGERTQAVTIYVGPEETKWLDDSVIDLGGTIRGTISSSEVRSYSNVQVSALNLSGDIIRTEPANESGSYSISGLQEGAYTVSFAEDTNAVSERQFYPDVPEWKGINAAAKVPVKKGAFTSGINASLVPGGSIEGILLDSQGVGLSETLVTAADTNGILLPRSTVTASNGHFALEGLSTGDYVVTARPGTENALHYPGVRNLENAKSLHVVTGKSVTIEPISYQQRVMPAAVMFTDKDGTKDDVYVVPATTGVEYLVGGKVVAAGTYPGSGTVTVTARALTGYVLAAGAMASWSGTFKATPFVVTPAAVTFTDKDGTKDDVYVVPAVTGVEYLIGGEVVA
uniref:MSCRAMM family protein n=1 Tax=Arthrobacter sp. LFS091 TaxID=3229892 RepID=UPI003A80FDE1